MSKFENDESRIAGAVFAEEALMRERLAEWEWDRYSRRDRESLFRTVRHNLLQNSKWDVPDFAELVVTSSFRYLEKEVRDAIASSLVMIPDQGFEFPKKLFWPPIKIVHQGR